MRPCGRVAPLDDAIHAKHAAVEEYLYGLIKDSQSHKRDTTISIANAALLCTAASEGQLDVLRDLVKVKGLSPDLGDYDTRTALHLAASDGRLDVIKCLIDELGANPSKADRWGVSSQDDSRER